MPPVSIKEVAARAGVSRATVSRVLNTSTYALVAAPTRERVLQVAVELGYHPNAVARGLAGKPMNSVGVVLAYILPSVTSDPYLGPVLDGILDKNKRLHQKTVLFTENDWNEAHRNLPIYCDGHCDGLILVIPHIENKVIPALKGKDIPFVVIGDSHNDPAVTMVDVDNVEIAYQAVTYLIAQGHTRIAALCGNAEFASSEQRLEGYRRAMRQAGIAVNESLVMPGEYWEWSGRENAEALMDRPQGERPTALFCSNGRIALGALHALEEMHIRVPTDVSLIALSENVELAGTNPPCTVVQMPLRQIGEQAVESLLAQIRESRSAGEKTLLPGSLVIRASVARL